MKVTTIRRGSGLKYFKEIKSGNIKSILEASDFLKQNHGYPQKFNRLVKLDVPVGSAFFVSLTMIHRGYIRGLHVDCFGRASIQDVMLAIEFINWRENRIKENERRGYPKDKSRNGSMVWDAHYRMWARNARIRTSRAS
jgi:hypothetical protein